MSADDRADGSSDGAENRQSATLVAVPGAEGLARVVADHPSAILLVDLETRQVVYANDLAAQLAPKSALPIDVEQWSRVAGLENADGDDLDRSKLPLFRIAAGEPVSGEQVTARRGSDATAAREDLWVIGMPLSDAPAPLNRRALVVFLPLRDRAAIGQVQQAGWELQHRAVISSEVSFSISDPNEPDDPLVWVNPAFELVTGYRGADVVGTNCRFLQGPRTDPAAVERIRDGIRSGGTVSETLLNYRADGTAFWNHIVISPVYDAEGRLTHHVGVQSDITERVESDAVRDRALDAAREAAQAAERALASAREAAVTAERALASAHAANTRLSALAAVSSQLTDDLVTGEATLDGLPAVVVAHFPGWAFAAGLDSRWQVTRVAAAHSDPARSTSARVVAAALLAWMRGAGAGFLQDAVDRVSTGTPLRASVPAATLHAVVTAAGLSGIDLTGVTGGTFVIAPLTAKGVLVGLLLVARDGEDAYDEADLAAVADLGVRAGVALDNARLYAREHAAAVTLQRSLLPTLPNLPGFDVAATYQPAHNQAEVGGDWYDVLSLPGTRGIGVAVGDVMGHDMRAAAAMGQLRSVLRSLAWAGDEPADVIGRLDELVRGLEMAALATCAYAVVSETGDDCTVTYTLAGHPPPMILHGNGEVERLDRALTSPVGVAGDGRTVPQSDASLPHGSYLVLYTDGLVERRHRDIDESVTALETVLKAAPLGACASELIEHIVESLTSREHDDDLCVLVLRRVAKPATTPTDQAPGALA